MDWIEGGGLPYHTTQSYTQPASHRIVYVWLLWLFVLPVHLPLSSFHTLSAMPNFTFPVARSRSRRRRLLVYLPMYNIIILGGSCLGFKSGAVVIIMIVLIPRPPVFID